MDAHALFKTHIDQTNDEISQLDQEVTIREKVLVQLKAELKKEKVITEERKQRIAELEEEIKQLQKKRRDLQDEILMLNNEITQTQQEIERVKQEIEDKDAKIALLEEELVELKRTPTPPPPPPPVEKPIFVPAKGDELDEMLARLLAEMGCTVPTKRLGGGYYMFGTRKIYAKIMNGKLVIRVGGGYMGLEEFVNTYADVELQRIDNLCSKGIDPFADWDKTDNQGRPQTAKGAKSPGRKLVGFN